MIVGGTGGKNDAIYGVSRNGGQQDGHHFHRGKPRFWDSLLYIVGKLWETAISARKTGGLYYSF